MCSTGNPSKSWNSLLKCTSSTHPATAALRRLAFMKEAGARTRPKTLLHNLSQTHISLLVATFKVNGSLRGQIPWRQVIPVGVQDNIVWGCCKVHALANIIKVSVVHGSERTADYKSNSNHPSLGCGQQKQSIATEQRSVP